MEPEKKPQNKRDSVSLKFDKIKKSGEVKIEG
jgi:hypothetical protein